MSATAVLEAEGVRSETTRPSSAVRIWAAVGVAFLAVQVWTWGSFLASGPGQITRFRDTGAPSWTWALVMQTTAGLTLAATVTAVVIEVRHRRAMTFNAMFMIACASLVWLDPMLNYFRPGFYYSANFVNVESWAPHLPGQIAPYANLVPEPLPWVLATYAGVFLPFSWLLSRLMIRARARWAGATRPRVFLSALLAAVVLDLILELPFCRTGLFAYPAATHDFAVWGGRTYQFPLVQCLGASFFWTSCAALMAWTDASGRTAVERGAETIRSPRRRTAARLLAVTGFVHVVFLAFPMGLAQLGPWYTDRFPTGYTADLHNGWCGDDGQPYGFCPAPGVPWMARPDHDAADPEDVYRNFPYFSEGADR